MGIFAIAREQAKARDRLVLARQAVDEMYTEVAEKWLADREQMTPLQRQFLEKALAFYTRFAAEQAGDPEDRHKAAQALDRVGGIRTRPGSEPDALASSEEAVARLEALAARPPGRPEYRRSLSAALGIRAEILEAKGDSAEAESSLRRAIAVARRAEAGGGGPAQAGEQESPCNYYHTSCPTSSARSGDSMRPNRRRTGRSRCARSGSKASPKDPEARLAMAAVLMQRASSSGHAGASAEAERSVRRRSPSARARGRRTPPRRDTGVTLPIAWNKLGAHHHGREHADGQPPAHRRGQGRFRAGRCGDGRLVESFPQVV